MMRQFLIASHGTFSSGVKSALDIITGATEQVFIIQAYVDENRTIEQELDAVLGQVSPDAELVVFTDLLGGSITNQVLTHALQGRAHVVSGFNLALVMEIILSDPAEPVDEVIENAIANAKEQLVYVNKLMNTEQATNTYD
ncbi:PTS sugar transporter subunit IIA [Hufsiella ginkgonis]|uniref:PTS EIIA type-4 domain-containing protein n=1 Tax=Hufsiella ginkgonis TaxID=2695274 RepID=A0A7K1Y0B5_9SPHI|nr:hypothetical protein [Hufsiella ginkgonis]MXV16449.1 hypothetical protein [Hufsiella ginkgonis]